MGFHQVTVFTVYHLGRFRGLVEWMRIGETRGTALDHLYYPGAEGIKERFVRFKNWNPRTF